jgi:hypothetical protein
MERSAIRMNYHENVMAGEGRAEGKTTRGILNGRASRYLISSLTEADSRVPEECRLFI